jgi:hypothetical protein
VQEEAVRRAYKFDAAKIGVQRSRGKIKETRGQLLYEWPVASFQNVTKTEPLQECHFLVCFRF